MCPAPPPGWWALQERAQRAKTSSELSEIIAEMNALLDEHEVSSPGAAQVTPRSRRCGRHTCVFYGGADSLLDFLVPYFVEGLRKGEYCFGAQKAEIRERLLSRLQSAGVEVEEEIRRGALAIHTDDAVYFPNQKFDPRAMMDTLRGTVENARTKGFSGVRTAGEMSWAPAHRTLWHQALDYEQQVDRFIPGKAMTGVCQYHQDVCTPATCDALVSVHRTHIRLPAGRR